MNKQLSSVLVIALGLLGALFVVFQVLSTGKNALGEAYKYFLPMSFFIGLLAPRFACYLLAIFAIYIDVGKKLLVVGEGLYFQDLFFILGVPPILLLGACLSRGLNLLWNWSSARVKKERESFLLASILISTVGALVILRAGLNMASLKELANSAAYLGLLFLIPSIFKEKHEIFLYFRFIVYAMIPAAGYGLYHFFFGMNDFELQYYSSGLSRNDIYVFGGEGVFGPFASQGALSSSSIIVAIMSIASFWISKRERHYYIHPVEAVILFFLFVVTAVLSLKRGPILILPASLLLYFVLRSRLGFVIASGCAVAATLLLVFFGSWIADQLPQWQVALNSAVGVDSSAEQSLFRIRTLNIRMVEFSSLSEPENWVPFGLLFGQGNENFDYTLHAGVVSLVHKLGYVPLIVGALVAVPLIWKVHGVYLELYRNGDRFGNLMFCLGAATVLVPMAGFGSQSVFPVPVFIGLCFGTFWLLRYVSTQASLEQESEQQDPEVITLTQNYAN